MEEERIFREKITDVGIMNAAFEIETKGEEVVALQQSSSQRGVPEMVCPPDAQYSKVLASTTQILDINKNPNKREQPEIDRDSERQSGISGRWTTDEHLRFVEALKKYGQKWEHITKYVGTRSSTQVRSHAQKYYLRLKKVVNGNKVEEFPSSSICKSETTFVTTKKKLETPQGITVEEALLPVSEKKLEDSSKTIKPLTPKISLSPVKVETSENEQVLKEIRSNIQLLSSSHRELEAIVNKLSLKDRTIPMLEEIIFQLEKIVRETLFEIQNIHGLGRVSDISLRLTIIAKILHFSIFFIQLHPILCSKWSLMLGSIHMGFNTISKLPSKFNSSALAPSFLLSHIEKRGCLASDIANQPLSKWVIKTSFDKSVPKGFAPNTKYMEKIHLFHKALNQTSP